MSNALPVEPFQSLRRRYCIVILRNFEFDSVANCLDDMFLLQIACISRGTTRQSAQGSGRSAGDRGFKSMNICLALTPSVKFAAYPK